APSLHPASFAVTVYAPTGSSGPAYDPLSLVVVSRAIPVRSLVTLTLAPASAAPVASLMVPVIWPAAVWAQDVPAVPSASSSTSADIDRVLIVTLQFEGRCET